MSESGGVFCICGGFLNQTANALTKAEIDTLPLSCFASTVELATRFLADYIVGDPYFYINYPEHNMVRAQQDCAGEGYAGENGSNGVHCAGMCEEI